MRRVLLLEQCLWIAESRIFCGYCAKGPLFLRVRLKQVPEYVQGETRFTDANTEKIIAVQARELKVLYLLPISNISDTI
jgi:aerobic-type carbon monoxide dehydrogenase small subunit (CoxS/CutS family)